MAEPGIETDFDLDAYRAQISWLADRGIFVGTSSWTYEGWIGQIYDRDRYLTRGKFSAARFDRECLQEYAETFRTVCFDGGYYTFPAEKKLQEMANQVPENFRFAFKVTDEITIRRFPQVPKHGQRGGQRNANFLDSNLFIEKFLKPAQGVLGPKLGPIIFEFTKMKTIDYPKAGDFIGDLSRFFSAVPNGPDYSVELRNREWLVPEYLETLKKYGVAHVFNSWTDMPPVSEQIKTVGDIRTDERSVGRFLLKPGRSYEEAVAMFKPYSGKKENIFEAEESLAYLIQEGYLKRVKGGTYLYINNRLEGNAHASIRGAIDILRNMGVAILERSDPSIPRRPKTARPKTAEQLGLGIDSRC